MNTPIKLDDLLYGYEWVSAGGQCDNQAYVNKTTGMVYTNAEGIDEDLDGELPSDYDDTTLYAAILNQSELGLGKHLALQYADDVSPEFATAVQEIFRKRGAYSRFKALLEQRGLLEDWFNYENTAIETALRAWAKDNDLQVE